MEPTPPPQQDYSPLKAAATAGRRAARQNRVAEPNQAASADHAAARETASAAAQPSAAATSTPQQPRAVKFAELSGPEEQEGPARASGGGAAGPELPPVKRVGFDLSSQGSGGFAQVEAGGPVFAGISRRKQEQLQKEQSEVAKQRSKYDEREVDRQVENIPDLEVEGRDDLTKMVAQAPRVHHARVQPMSELQRDQAWVPAGTGADIDLSLLTACLCPSDQVQEELDEVWEPDQLLSSLKSELEPGHDVHGGQQESEDLPHV